MFLRSARAVLRTSELGVIVRGGLVVTVLFPGRLDVAAEVAVLAQPAERGRP